MNYQSYVTAARAFDIAFDDLPSQLSMPTPTFAKLKALETITTDIDGALQ